MRAQRLDLGLALAAAARGYRVGKYSDPNETLFMKNGAMMVERTKGKDALFSSLKSLDFKSYDYYVQGDDNAWMQTAIKI